MTRARPAQHDSWNHDDPAERAALRDTSTAPAGSTRTPPGRQASSARPAAAMVLSAVMSHLPVVGVFEVLVACVVLLAVRYYVRTARFWTSRGVMSKGGLPILGSAPALILQTQYRGRIMQKFYREARAKNEPCVGLFVASQPTLLLVDQDLLRSVLVKDFSHFMDRGMAFDRHREPLTANLFSIEGAEWRALRHKLTPTFTSGKMRNMFPLVQACADELTAVLAAEAAAGRPVEMFELLARFTTDIIGSCAFGIQANALKDPDSEFRVMGKKAFDLNILQIFFGLVVPKALPYARAIFPNLRLIHKSVADFFTRQASVPRAEGAAETFEENVEYRQKNKVVRHDFVDILMQLKSKNSGDTDGIDADILPAQAFIFFLAGFETSSSTLANVMTELAHNPDVQDKVRAEVERVLAKHNGNITYEALGELTYMEQVIDETMRLYPALANITRVVNEDYVLPTTTADGKPAVLPKGIKVIIPTFALHRDPEFYPEPDKFNPDNFTDEAKRSRPNFAFLPFGEGPRICIGLRFAMMQMKSGLATILRSFRVLPVEGANDYPPEFEVRTFVTKVKGGNKVILRAL
ncbi:putative cytochrome P450 6a23 [Frankliniella fusca]|uniref:Cytochrome P450 6a23 n=1 Tax=Frankliniella fusca TaxID=407009 RepID=A0AAE1HPD8_9NEOP|nr:putative cytochrome P450 6a23 [Frankliniella fusca]